MVFCVGIHKFFTDATITYTMAYMNVNRVILKRYLRKVVRIVNKYNFM